MDEAFRLEAAMASRKLLILAFIRAYIGRWGGSPSHSEIAEGTGSRRDAVKKALAVLEAEGRILRRPGARGIGLPDRLADALTELRACGYIIDEDIVRGPFPPLPPTPELDYDPG